MDPKKMKVPELRAELEKRGLSPEGKKPDLVSRLQSRLDEEEFGLVPAVGAAPSPSSAGGAVAAAAAPPPPPDPTPTKAPAKVIQKPDPPVAVAAKPPVEPPATAPKDTTPKEQAAASTAPVGTASLKPKTDSMTFQEKKQLRKERFGIVDDAEAKGTGAGTTGAVSAEELEKRKKRAQKFGTTVKGAAGEEEATTGESRAKKSKKDAHKEETLLPKEEIERQLERIRKLGGSEERADELKAMLRKYRFEKKE